jgi:hypothetical protein
MPRARAALAAGAGFLLGVLWMDLMFDVQVFGHAGQLPEPVLASIAAYYRRVTTDASPMSALIATTMALVVGGSLWQALRAPGWRSVAALVLIAVPVALAAVRVVPNAVRLGQRTDPPVVQDTLARAIARDHVLCLAAVAAFLMMQCVVPDARTKRGARGIPPDGTSAPPRTKQC